MPNVFITRYSVQSPIHDVPPDYSGGLGSIYDFGIIADDTISNRVPSGEPVHWRSRQRHDPGSGVYTNRWAFAQSDGTARLPSSIYGGRRLVFQSDRVFNWRDYRPSDNKKDGFEHWDGQTYVSGYLNKNGAYWRANFYCVWYDPAVIYRVSSGTLQAGFQAKYLGRGSSRFISEDEAREYYEKYLKIYLSYHYSDVIPGSYSTGRVYTPVLCASDDLIVDGGEAKLSPEMDTFGDSITMLPHTHIGTLEAEAYVEAVDKLPHSGVNNIANIAEVVNLINRMLFSGGLTTVGTVSDAWLAYRYSYSTSKADAEELARLVERLWNLSGVSTVTTRSVVTDGEYTVRCAIAIQSALVSQIHDFCSRWGLRLSGSNLWDMIPYSFIADWFLAIGPALEHGEAIRFAYQCRVPAWFSIERRWINEFGCTELFYHRHKARPNLSEAYLYRTVHSASGVTIVKRAIDALALVR